jgi:hypothetical protein
MSECSSLNKYHPNFLWYMQTLTHIEVRGDANRIEESLVLRQELESSPEMAGCVQAYFVRAVQQTAIPECPTAAEGCQHRLGNIHTAEPRAELKPSLLSVCLLLGTQRIQLYYGVCSRHPLPFPEALFQGTQSTIPRRAEALDLDFLCSNGSDNKGGVHLSGLRRHVN